MKKIKYKWVKSTYCDYLIWLPGRGEFFLFVKKYILDFARASAAHHYYYRFFKSNWKTNRRNPLERQPRYSIRISFFHLNNHNNGRWLLSSQKGSQVTSCQYYESNFFIYFYIFLYCSDHHWRVLKYGLITNFLPSLIITFNK